MKLCAAGITIMLLLSQVGFGQTIPDSQALVKNIIESGIIDGVADKQLSRAGDASAVAVTKVVGAHDLNAVQIGSILAILAIIHLSFSRLSIVEDAVEREPRTTLFVLHYLGETASDTALKQEIASEASYVIAQYKSLSNQAKK